MFRRAKNVVGDLSEIIDHLHESVIVADQDGYITKWNKRAERLFGYTSEEAIGQHSEICHARSREDMDREIGRLIRRDGHIDIVGKMVRKSGEIFDGHPGSDQSAA